MRKELLELKNQEVRVDKSFEELLSRFQNKELTQTQFREEARKLFEEFSPGKIKIKEPTIFDELKAMRDGGEIAEESFRRISQEFLEAMPEPEDKKKLQ